MNVSDGPSQDTPSLVNVGVTSIVATTGVVPVLIATKEEISPEPGVVRPILGVSLVQE